MKLLYNEPLPAEIRSRLMDDAKMQDLPVSDIAVAILGSHFNMVIEPGNTPYREPGDLVKIWGPDTLHRKIRMAIARDSKLTMRGIVLSVLAEHYDLEPIDPSRRPRSRT